MRLGLRQRGLACVPGGRGRVLGGTQPSGLSWCVVGNIMSSWFGGASTALNHCSKTVVVLSFSVRRQRVVFSRPFLVPALGVWYPQGRNYPEVSQSIVQFLRLLVFFLRLRKKSEVRKGDVPEGSGDVRLVSLVDP